MTKKQKRLSLGMALLFLFMFVFFGYIMIWENGNPIKESVVKRKIEAYQKELFPLIMEEFKQSPIAFDPKDRSYHITYTMKQNKDFFFLIIYDKQEKLSDTYQTNIIEGKEVLETKRQKLEKKFPNDKIELDKTLDQLDEKEQIKSGKPARIYTLVKEIELEEMTIENYVLEFQNLQKETTKIDKENILNYSITFIDAETKEKVIIKKISHQTIDQGTKELTNKIKERLKERG